MLISMSTDMIVRHIDGAKARVTYVAPGISGPVGEALLRAVDRLAPNRLTLVLDGSEEVHRLGYGDAKGLTTVLALQHRANLLHQSGLRLCLLVADDLVSVWTPTPLAVERERAADEPCGLVLIPTTDPAALIDSTAHGSNGGQQPLSVTEVQRVIEALKANPPAPFDLSRISRVFSTKYQFVELELQGAEWTHREIALSSILINSDVPKGLQDLLDTRVKPFAGEEDVAVDVQVLVDGRLAYSKSGEPLVRPQTQVQIRRAYESLRAKHLKHLKDYGWILDRATKADFIDELAGFTEVLKAWVTGFREQVGLREEQLIEKLTTLINERLKRAPRDHGMTPDAVTRLVRDGVKNLRVRDPGVKVVFKDITPESTRDAAFLDALDKVLTGEDKRNWFHAFDAAHRRVEEQSQQSDLFS